MSNNLIKKFKNFIFKEKIFNSGDKIIVAISGGLDSISLVNLLLLLREKYNLQLYLVHINYHLRGQDSDEDEKFVKKFAKEKNIPFKVINYQEDTQKKVGNLEERLRDFRYQEFEKIRKVKKYDWIAVAHHQDDQIETFLLNLFRGAGLKGLSGMRFKEKKRKIIRPLLNFSKQELQALLENRQEKWREDKSNLDNNFSRNKIRNKLIPLIEKEYSSQFRKKISQTVRQFQDYQDIGEESVEKILKDIIKRQFDDEIILRRDKFLILSTAMQSLVFRKIIKIVKGDLKNINYEHYQEFLKIIKSTKGKKQRIVLGNIQLKRNGNNLKFSIC